MKAIRFLTGMLVVSLLIGGTATFAQNGDKEVVTIERRVAFFNQIDVGGAFTVFITQGDEISVKVETDKNLQDKVITEVENNTLTIGSKSLHNPTELTIYITFTELERLDAHGASTLKGDSPIKGEEFELIASGASNVNMVLEVEELNSEVAGTAYVELDGTAKTHEAEVSGASTLNALNLVTQETEINVSGVAHAKVTARERLEGETAGSATLTYYDEPVIKKINKKGEFELEFNDFDNLDKLRHLDISTKTYGDSTKVKVGNIEVKVYGDEERTEVQVGSSRLTVDEEGNVDFDRKKKKRHEFDGHWAGFELGVNGYLNPDNELDLPAEYEYLDLRMEKSINVGINFFEQNFNLIRNHFGMITGLGLEYNNYRFDSDVKLLDSDAGIIRDFDFATDEEISHNKSKLVATYLNLPILLEYQTNRHSDASSFHLTAGMISGVRIGTHTKLVYNRNGDRNKDKDRSDFHLNPFKFAATARLGWGKLNLYANYSLTPLFKDDKGPELYPFALGISLIGW
ncbi:MAG: DUF2807 domain-containing protein [Bacteroidales bacterium]|nr:DUF2807 domain-containing protein [Bacteroidales bacterium]